MEGKVPFTPRTRPSGRRKIEQWLDLWEAGNVEDPRLSSPEPTLERHFDRFVERFRHPSVLVPFCGRSYDMAWLADQGLQVVGVEASRRAIAIFAAERGFSLVQSDTAETNSMTSWFAGPVTIFEGDWFDATPEALGGNFALAYDNGALSAADPSRRAYYAEVLSRVLKPAARILLLAPDFDEGAFDAGLVALGPHSLSLPQIKELFPDFSMEVLEEADSAELPIFAKLRKHGLKSALLRTVLLERPITSNGMLESW